MGCVEPARPMRPRHRTSGHLLDRAAFERARAAERVWSGALNNKRSNRVIYVSAFDLLCVRSAFRERGAVPPVRAAIKPDGGEEGGWQIGTAGPRPSSPREARRTGASRRQRHPGPLLRPGMPSGGGSGLRPRAGSAGLCCDYRDTCCCRSLPHRLPRSRRRCANAAGIPDAKQTGPRGLRPLPMIARTFTCDHPEACGARGRDRREIAY